jgi:hypothetical protein
MNNKKCPYCGFINFVDAELCRKCETNLSASEDGYQSSYNEPPTYRGGSNAYALPYPTKSGMSAGKVFACVGGLVFGAIIYTFGMGLIRGHAKVSWVEYHPDGQNITVMMPNEPTREEPEQTPLPMGSITIHSFTSVVSGQGAAIFGYADYSGIDFEDTSKALDSGLNGLVTKSKSTLVSKTPINYQGMPGLEFEVTPPASAGINNGRGYGKLLLSNNRLYILFITASENTDLLAGKDQFLNPRMMQEASRPAMIKVPPMNIPSFKPIEPYQPPAR